MLTARTPPAWFRRAFESSGVDPDALWSVFQSSGGPEYIEALCRQHPHNGRPHLVVGEAPGPKGDPSYPLFPIPAHCAGGRVARAIEGVYVYAKHLYEKENA